MYAIVPIIAPASVIGRRARSSSAGRIGRNEEFGEAKVQDLDAILVESP